ncbi:hypothetical protein C8P64_0048 [Christiangramia gaetbulicola]|uniref:Transferase family hexapeptide repeat protein n=1 Tax=Christiangramia gaetbulicola TaxID=703340 RepID=A0A2T6AJT8_9FLAO|nr:hypothetical protein [Christiangramia gaetbulicola]PTX44078.1 hypothetical protein C8P64_0048 [Christiangramia gaetbulicola]
MIKRFSRKFLFKIIKYCPFNNMRLYIYRHFFKYSIGKDVYIGKSIINSENVEIGNRVIIRNKCLFNCKNLKIGDGTAIHSGNTIIGKSSFTIGRNSRLINDHYIDVWNEVIIGRNTWLAGKRTEIWTHGSIHTKSNLKDLSVSIGDDVYIASSCLIAPGVKIHSINLIGLGSVLVNSIDTEKNIVIGNPARIVKKEIDWRKYW